MVCSYQKLNKIKDRSPLSKKILLLLFIINTFAFFSVNILNIYKNVSIFNVFLYIVVIFFSGRIKNKIMYKLFYLLFLSTFLLFAIQINDGGLGSIINFLYGFIIVLAFSKYKFTHKDYRLLLIVLTMLNLYWVFNSKGYFYKVIYGGEYNINPNVVGYLILYSCMLICIILQKAYIRNSNFYAIITLLLSYYGIIQLSARGSLLALLVFTFIYLLVSKKSIWRKTTLIKLCYWGVVIVGATFPLAYLYMYNRGIDFSIPFINKSLYTGREVIWQSFYLTMDTPIKWLFGLGSNSQLIGIQEKMDLHNNYLAILANFGVIGFIAYYSFMFKFISDICKNNRQSQCSVKLIVGFFGVLIHGFFEATIYFSPIFVFMFIFLGLALSEQYYYGSVKVDVKKN